MSLLWQLQTEMLSFFFEPNRLLDVVSSFLQGEGFLAGCGFWGKEETSAEFQLAKLQENMYIIFGGISQFSFLTLIIWMYAWNLMIFFPNSKGKKNPIHMPISKKSTAWNAFNRRFENTE